ncbi:unnamed protein product, partial [Rotaria magnacalcarata]
MKKCISYLINKVFYNETGDNNFHNLF